MKNESELLKFAAYSPIILILTNLLIYFPLNIALDFINIGSLSIIFTSLFSLVFLFLYILFLQGFMIIGGRYNSKLLKLIVAVGMILCIITSVASLSLSIYVELTPKENLVKLALGDEINYEDFIEYSKNKQNPDNSIPQDIKEKIEGRILKLVLYILLFCLVYLIIYSVYTIVFGIALLKLKNKLEHAKATGILMIISGATYIIFIGFVIRFVAWIFQIMLLFEASKKMKHK